MRFILVFQLFMITMGTLHAQLLDAVALDSMRTYRSLDRALKEPELVYRLDLSGEKLKTFPEELYLLKNLNALDLSGNKLKELPARLGEFIYMQEFRASKNKLKKFPEAVCKWVHLKRLDMSRNALDSLPPCMGRLKELMSMDLWDNDLAGFPDELSSMKALRFLDLRAIQFDEPEMERIQRLLPSAKVYFSQPCNCGE